MSTRQGRQSSVVHHFHEKLLRLKDDMLTASRQGARQGPPPVHGAVLGSAETRVETRGRCYPRRRPFRMTAAQKLVFPPQMNDADAGFFSSGSAQTATWRW